MYYLKYVNDFNNYAKSCSACSEGLMIVGRLVFIIKLVLSTSLGYSRTKLSESSFNSFLDCGEQLEFFFSGLCGGVVLFSSGIAEVLCVIPELLVSISLSGGRGDDSLLGNNAFV